nr:MAG: RNA-dependent RNA polymerase [Cystoviridae sp.]
MGDFKYVEPFTYLKKDRETDRLRRYYSVKNSPRKLLLLPGRSNSSLEYLRFMRELYRVLQDAYPQSPFHGAGFASPGISDDWTKLTSIQGVMPDPAGTPPYDVTELMKDKFEQSKNPTHVAYALGNLEFGGERTRRPFELLKSTRDFIDIVVSLLINRGEPGSIPVKESVSTGLPGMDKDIPMKKAWGDKWCNAKWAEKVLTHVWKGDLSGLYESEDVLLAYTQGYRTQPDRLIKVGEKTVPKERLVYDWMGDWTKADRTLPMDWLSKHAEGADEATMLSMLASFFCCRSRQISISPYRATFPLRLLAHSMHSYMAASWKWLLYHPDISALNTKLTGARHVRLVDVENHDQSINEYILNAFLKRTESLFIPEIAKLMRLMYHAPSLVRNDHRFESGASWRGNPFDEETYRAIFVNPSGDPNTSNLAKLAGIIYGTYVFYMKGLVSADPTSITALWNGAFDYGFFNSGDNLLFYDKRPQSFLEEDGWDRDLYFAQLAVSPAFLGFVPIQDSPGGRVTFTMNMQSFIMNFFLADKGIESPDRRFWAYGWFERKEAYQANPSLKEVDALIQITARRTLGVSIDTLADAAYRSPTNTQGLNAAEVDFVTNPDTIYYKYSTKDIREELIQQYFLTYRPERTSELWRFLKGD